MKKIEPMITAEQIATRTQAVGADIRRDAGKETVFLLGVLKGSSCFLTDLLRSIEGQVEYGFIDVFRDEADSGAALQIDYLRHGDIAGKNVYVVKDVVSTGIIETYLLTQLRVQHPRTLKLVALRDRPTARTVDLNADFKAFEVEEGSYVGYGLELENRWSNLPYIGKL